MLILKPQKILFLFMILLSLIFCRDSSAIQINKYFDIAKDYQENPQAAIIKWLGKEICLEEEINNTGVNAKDGAYILFTKASFDSLIEHVAYGFHFNGQPENIKQLQKGQKVRVRGKIISIKMDDDALINRLEIQIEPSRLLKVYPYSPNPEDINKAEWFFTIPVMYERDPEITKKSWLGKEIIIEHEIGLISFVDDDGNAADSGNAMITFVGKASYLNVQNVGYMFLFDGTPDEIAKLTQGQKIKISGIVTEITLKENIYIIVVTSSKLVE